MKCLLLSLLGVASLCAQVPRNCTQAVVGVASGWNSSHVTLRVYEKDGGAWRQIGPAWKGRLGKNGLAWGQGIHPQVRDKHLVKKEGDKRAPAGIFKIGGAYGYAAAIQKHPALTYRKVTSRDLWVENRGSPHYNRHLVLKHEPSAPWEKKAQMKQGDYAHALKLYIAHNDAMLGGKPVPGLGSAIFFHIWRGGGSKPTAGCTTMDKGKLSQLIARIDPRRHPVYILLPQADYAARRSSWNLP